MDPRDGKAEFEHAAACQVGSDLRARPHQLKVEYRAASALIPYVRNARTHSEVQVAQIAASIREFGWTNPIPVDGEHGIIAGHGRLLAARKLDNKMALNAGWDNELLGLELGDLDALGFDLSLTGFDELELAALTALGSLGLTIPTTFPSHRNR